MYVLQGRNRDALEDLNHCIQLNPSHIKSRLERARLVLVEFTAMERDFVSEFRRSPSVFLLLITVLTVPIFLPLEYIAVFFLQLGRFVFVCVYVLPHFYFLSIKIDVYIYVRFGNLSFRS